MKFKVRVSELRYGDVEVDAANAEQAKRVASGAEINWFDSEITDMTVEDAFDAMLEDEDEYIKKHLPTLEILCGLAEEASELSQAALKLRRALDGTNPTPVPGKVAMDALLEEFADVTLCGKLLLTEAQVQQLKEIRKQKRTRWVHRLKAAEQDRHTYEVTEVCPHCEREVTMTWDVLTDGFKAFCPFCGGRLMLCDECQHCEVDPVCCDYDRETDSCQMNRGDEKKESALLAFIREEVGFRLVEILGVKEKDITPELIEELAHALDDNSDVMFNYDKLDGYLEGLLDRKGVKHE